MSKTEIWTSLDKFNGTTWPKEKPFPSLFIPTQYNYIHEKRLTNELNDSSNYFTETQSKPTNIEKTINNKPKNNTKRFHDNINTNTNIYQSNNSNKSPIIEYNHKPIKPANKRSKTPKINLKLDQYHSNNNNNNEFDDYRLIETNSIWIGFSQNERSSFLKWSGLKLKKHVYNRGHYLTNENGHELKYNEIKTEIDNYCHKFNIFNHNNNNLDNNKSFNYKNIKYFKFDWETSWKQFLTIEQFNDWNMFNKYQKKAFLKWGAFYLENSHKHRNEHILMAPKGVPLTANAINQAFHFYHNNQKKKFFNNNNFINNHNNIKYNDRDIHINRDRYRDNHNRQDNRNRDRNRMREFDRNNYRDRFDMNPRKKRRFSHQ